MIVHKSSKKETTTKTTAVKWGQRVSIVSTVILILLMFIYLIMSIRNSSSLAEQTEIISGHPFEVVNSIGDIKLYISEMRLRTERMQRHRSVEDVEIARDALKNIYLSLEEPLFRVEDLYLGNAEDIQALNSTLELLQTEQDMFFEVALRPDITDKEIEGYEQEHLQPLYDKAFAQAEGIIGVAQEKKVGYGETAERLRRSNLIGSILLMSLMVGVLLVSQYVLLRQRRELIWRNLLFDKLSLSIDDAFIIRDANTNEINYRGLNIERVVGTSVPDVESLYEGLKPEDARIFREEIRGMKFVSPFERLVEYKKPDGDWRWMLIRVYRVEDTSSPQLITVFSDRTEEVLSRQVLQDAMLTAERSNTAKSDFLSRMSHEIRTPLNAIIGMTAIAAASIRDTARVEDCLSKITFSSKHLLMLINDVLDMSKIESSKMSLQDEPFDIFEIVNGFVSTVYAQAKAKEIEFKESMEGFGEDTVFIGDALRLNQILLNLSSNAVKFTPPGGSIRLHVSHLVAGGRTDIIRFTIADTGIGMTKEALERIFQPFEQADASITKRYGGTGLGMSITKNLAALMGGEIHVESEPGVGTTCTVDLPFKRGGEQDMVEPDFAQMGLSALVVDDDQQACEQAVVLMKKIKIDANWCLSGTEALKQVKERHYRGCDFDFCLVDWKMPDMDGIEITRRIRREVGNDLPIVMISAYDITEVEQEAKAVGVNGFLAKPLYRSSVYAAIKEALENRLAPSEEALAKEKLPLKDYHLLVAEDNAINQEIAATLLRMNGATVDCVDDGRQAVERFLASEPGEYNAILMDVQMPVMDGHEAARQIRISAHPLAHKIPIIATTANAFTEDISAALSAGMNAHVSKPLDIHQLCNVLSSCISESGLRERKKIE